MNEYRNFIGSNSLAFIIVYILCIISGAFGVIYHKNYLDLFSGILVIILSVVAITLHVLIVLKNKL